MRALKNWVKHALGRGDPLSRHAYSGVRRLYYLGRRVQCPCCGGRFRRFVSIPRVNEPDDLECPRCGCYARHRQLWLFLTRRLDVLTKPLTLLHVAPEVFFYTRLESAPNLEYVSADLEAPHARVPMDVTAIPYADEHFDGVVCSHVLEHVPDDRTAMRELCRVLKRGGWAVIQAPVHWNLESTREDPSVTDPAERARRFGAEDHLRIYGPDYLDRLRAAGFEVTVEAFARDTGAQDARRHGLLPVEPIYLCRRD